jgi:CRISPR-associated endoribonuclease Cas6
MPCSIEIPLDKRQVSRLPRNAVPALHANFFRWLEESHPDSGPTLARSLDSAQGLKPFTVSPLYIEREWASFRITLLQDALFDPLRAGMEKRPYVNVLGEEMSIAGPRSVVATTYPLLAQTPPVDESGVVLRFRTPASFRRQEMDYPLPDPVLVFDSYRRRWNSFAHEELQIDERWLEWVKTAVTISRFDLRTEPKRFPDGLQIGCTGRIQFGLSRRAAREQTQGYGRDGSAVLAQLAEYAFYCGTGRKTTQGMGQTARLARFEE